MTERWVDARTAAKHLGIQLRTLYAYVSRGAVRSAAGTRGRPRLYALADVDRLRVRRDARAGHGAVAAGALRWGEPVLDSAITAITPRGPAYRGRLAVDLAADVSAGGRTFEDVAELLWTGVMPERAEWPRAPLQAARLAKLAGGAHPLDVMAIAVALAQVEDRHASDDLLTRARPLIAHLAACLAPDAATMTRAHGAGSIAEIAARALGVPGDAAAIEVALVVLADHELNASSFTCRVAASTGASAYACVAAALATLSGPKHGRAPEDVARYADEVGGPDRARAALRTASRAGVVPPGFGHTLYPHGDPRATPLLDLARTSSARRARTLVALADASETPASCDIGLAALVASLGAAPSAASGLFAVARCAGWIAHALEQRDAGVLLRPRARYVGAAVVR